MYTRSTADKLTGVNQKW
uniref:Uncharacterized protein n=1 Tax=Arundo donax TaxID=35708 RepID=A0A0A9AJV1_ARUDO